MSKPFSKVLEFPVAKLKSRGRVREMPAYLAVASRAVCAYSEGGWRSGEPRWLLRVGVVRTRVSVALSRAFFGGRYSRVPLVVAAS
eukprot:329034-Pleurochrysis_carterae.AAC.1